MSSRLNLLDPAVRANPYPHYARLRRESPVCQIEPNGFWALTRHDDIQNAFKNSDVFSSSALRLAGEPPWLQRRNPINDSMITADPPHHGRLRNLVSRAFTPNMVGRMEAYARDVGTRMVDMLFQSETVDFLPEFALGMPANLMALLLSVDPALQKKFKGWADDISGAVTVAPDDLVRQERVRTTLTEMDAYLREVLAKRRKKPTDDLVSDLLRSEENGERLTDDELISFLSLLLVAGLETTTFLLCHIAIILARNPEWFDRLRNNDVLINQFIEEVLRFEPANQCSLRLAIKDVEMSGVVIPAGSPVLLITASGLRDETHFPDADRFNPERGGHANLIFGHGAHFCLGAPLARMEARVALDIILGSCSRLELVEPEISWQNSLFF
ncbi:MAG: cytochrome P450, partial [Cystobacter sp.]